MANCWYKIVGKTITKHSTNETFSNSELESEDKEIWYNLEAKVVILSCGNKWIYNVFKSFWCKIGKVYEEVVESKVKISCRNKSSGVWNWTPFFALVVDVVAAEFRGEEDEGEEGEDGEEEEEGGGGGGIVVDGEDVVNALELEGGVGGGGGGGGEEPLFDWDPAGVVLFLAESWKDGGLVVGSTTSWLLLGDDDPQPILWYK